MTTEHRPHIELVQLDAKDAAESLRLFVEQAAAHGLDDDFMVKVSVKFMRDLFEQYEDAQATITTLEVACDHHRMFWQKAEERERGLKEQLEALREALERIVRTFQWRDPEDLPKLAFTLKEIALEAIASIPANNLNLGEQAQENALGASSAASEPK